MMDQQDFDQSGLYDYYVYELRDPRNNETFYVGMGQGPRVYFHGKDRKSPDHPKERRIFDIKQDGHPDCLRVIIGSYKTAEEAFAVEATLINWVYGREILSNINPGRHSWCIRPASQHKNRIHNPSDDYPHMDGIDRPRPVRVFDGTYTQNQLQNIAQNNIPEKLNWLCAEISKRKNEGAEEMQNVQVVGPKLDRPQDPELVLSIDDAPVSAHLKLQLTGQLVSFNLRPKDSRRASHVEFVRHVTNSILEPYDLKTKRGGLRNYVKAEPKGTKYCDIPYDDIDTILLVLKKAQLRLTQLRPE